MVTKPNADNVLRAAVRAVEKADGHRGRAAVALGIPVGTLKDRLRQAVTSGLIQAFPRTFLATRYAAEGERPEQTIDDDLARQKSRVGQKDVERKYQESLATIDAQRRALEASYALARPVETVVIEPKHGGSTSEATAIALAGDWHIEEEVGKEVGGLNVYNLDIAQACAAQFFRAVVSLTRMSQQDVKIEHLVLGLLGDFISGDIHDELRERCQLRPTEAIVMAQRMLVSGIEFILNHSKVSILAVCKSGNHARTTKKVFVSNEQGHSLEYLMYQHLAAHFRSEKRVQFQIDESYHSYVQIYRETAAFHHGHHVNYQGGVGGLTIPMNKAIDRWNEARPATVYFNGHHHTSLDGERFVSNGSMIGHSAFSVSIKAPYGEPRQWFNLIDKRRGRTGRWPILFDNRKATRAA